MLFNVIRDTREKSGFWTFSKVQEVHDIQVAKLDEGDYAIQGLPDKTFVVERKASVSEIAANVLEDRFERELERLSEYKKSFIICEFDIPDIISYPVGSKIPKSRWKKVRVKGKFIMRKLASFSIKYPTNILFCSDRNYAQAMCASLMKEAFRKYYGS